MRIALHLHAVFFLAGTVGFSQEEKPATAPVTRTGEVWLGLGLSKPGDTTTTQLPSLPPGIGFVVTELDEGGPAAKAGVRKLDLLWKMGEQMLVNEGQLAILLRLSMPGEEVVVSVFREGKPMDLKITLGEAKDDDGAVTRRVLTDSVMRGKDGALRIVNLGEKRAIISNKKGRAEVMRVSQGDAVKIVDIEGIVIYEGVIRGRPEFSQVPEGWRRQICAMRRSLEHALTVQAVPVVRKPRPRIVPPIPKGKE